MLYLIPVARVRFDEPSGKWSIVRIGRKEGASVIGQIRRVCLLHDIPFVKLLDANREFHELRASSYALQGLG